MTADASMAKNKNWNDMTSPFSRLLRMFFPLDHRFLIVAVLALERDFKDAIQSPVTKKMQSEDDLEWGCSRTRVHLSGLT